MAGRFDQPWNFIGEVKTNQRSVVCHCLKCNQREPIYRDNPNWVDYAPLITVNCDGYLFITDDMIEVMVYFGVCRECDSVFWARSGPPFRRARACVPSSS